MTRIAVVSDVHAFEPSPGAERFAEHDPSWVRTIPDAHESSRAPFQALESMILAEGVRADVIVSCGDMGDKASHPGVVYAWSYLETIRRRLGASTLLGTTGNHDMDSRNSSGRSDAAYMTRGLQPPFPVDDPAPRGDYWNKHVARTVLHGTDFILLNTAAEHDDPDMASRGRISEATLDEVRSVVETCHQPKRVLVAHHHPYRHDALDRADYSEMDGGPELLRILQENYEWLVIHGHRHYPNIAYATGGAQAPVIIAAGSFSARLYPELQTRVRNQFHIVDLSEPGTLGGTSGAVGSVESWEWTPSAGWVTPTSIEGIPNGAGFGYRASIADAATLIETFVGATGSQYVALSDVLEAHPQLRYLIPFDREATLRRIQSAGKVRVSPTQSYFVDPAEIFLSEVS